MNVNDFDPDDHPRQPTSKQGVYEVRLFGYDIELDLEGASGCETTQCCVSRGAYSASLECLMAEGVLLNGEKELKVDPAVVGAIENWAYRNGY